jgi:hypothetical protein
VIEAAALCKLHFLYSNQTGPTGRNELEMRRSGSYLLCALFSPPSFEEEEEEEGGGIKLNEKRHSADETISPAHGQNRLAGASERQT